MSKTLELWDKYMLGNYSVPAITLVKGEGSRVWDDSGKEYLDFSSGIAVSALGHNHPVWTKFIEEQIHKIAHTSNIFANENAPKLAQKIVEHMKGGRVFFCNSGAEANEALLKLSRLYGRSLSNGEEGKRFKVVVCGHAFHGRLFGTMSATPQEKIQKGFAPLTPGFDVATFNDIESFKQLIDENTSAVLLEAVQGEGGLALSNIDFLKDLRALCTEKNVLLMFDEIQCGIARTGKMYGFEHSGVLPDAFSMAKGLGGGFPIGAVWMSDKCADLFKPGMHGTTFGGNPMACVAGLAVWTTIEKENLIEKVAKNSAIWRKGLQALVEKYPSILKEVRGIGYLSGLAFYESQLPWVSKFREAGLLSVVAGCNVIRLLPPLNISLEDLEESLKIMDSVFSGKNL